MSVLDGRARCVALHRAGDPTPVILMTADQPGPAVARELGTAACLVKSFSVESLMAAIEAVVQLQARSCGIHATFHSSNQLRFLA
jgi:DNA-binding response OmpR family regulator